MKNNGLKYKLFYQNRIASAISFGLVIVLIWGVLMYVVTGAMTGNWLLNSFLLSLGIGVVLAAALIAYYRYEYSQAIKRFQTGIRETPSRKYVSKYDINDIHEFDRVVLWLKKQRYCKVVKEDRENLIMVGVIDWILFGYMVRIIFEDKGDGTKERRQTNYVARANFLNFIDPYRNEPLMKK